MVKRGAWGAVGQKQVTRCCGRQTAAFSFVRAEDRGVRDWQGREVRAGVQEDIHCAL